MFYYDRVLNDYDPDNDTGPGARVSWAEGYLAKDVETLHGRVRDLTIQNAALTAAITNLQVRIARLEGGGGG